MSVISNKQDEFTEELLQVQDFEEDFYYSFYEEAPFIPHIVFRLERGSKKKKPNISEIIIRLDKNNDDKEPIPKFKLYELFLDPLWDRLFNTERKNKRVISYSNIYEYMKYRKRATRRFYINSSHGIWHLYESSPFLNYYQNIWNSYCLFEGFTTIARNEFCLWLYRLNSVIFDLLCHNFLEDKNWIKRVELITKFINNKDCQYFEYMIPENWKSAISEEFLSKESALKARIKDSQRLLNYFNDQVELKSPLESFIKSVYDSFGKRLYEDKLILKCNHCNRYIDYRERKKYCSLLSEGRDCGKAARNKRDYLKHKKKRKSYSRKEMRETRRYIKEVEIKNK